MRKILVWIVVVLAFAVLMPFAITYILFEWVAIIAKGVARILDVSIQTALKQLEHVLESVAQPNDGNRPSL